MYKIGSVSRIFSLLPNIKSNNGVNSYANWNYKKRHVSFTKRIVFTIIIYVSTLYIHTYIEREKKYICILVYSILKEYVVFFLSVYITCICLALTKCQPCTRVIDNPGYGYFDSRIC